MCFSCPWSISLGPHSIRKLLLKTAVWHLSWRSQSICECLVEMDLNYSFPVSNLFMGYWCKETDWFHSLCGQSPWHYSCHEISLPLSQMVFFAWGWLRLSYLHFHQILKQSGKERNAHLMSYLLWARLKILCRSIISLKTYKFGGINFVRGNSFRKIK